MREKADRDVVAPKRGAIEHESTVREIVVQAASGTVDATVAQRGVSFRFATETTGVAVVSCDQRAAVMVRRPIASV